MSQLSKDKQDLRLKVKSALEAVVAMDESLTKDLKSVKDGIQKGIQNVITSLEVETLDKKVRDDLKTLKQRIEKLNEQVEPPGGLVSGQLEQLKNAEEEFNQKTNPITMETRNLDQNFKSAIQQPLTQAVTAVDTAIEALGGNFKDLKKDQNKISGILEHIKDKVAEIKGKGGSGWDNKGGSGLEGIAYGLISCYANAFKDTFESIYLEERNGGKSLCKTVRDHFPELFTVRDGIKDAIKNELQSEINAGKGQVKISNGEIAKSIASVKKGCETFASGLDNRLKEGIGNMAGQIFGRISKGINRGKEQEIKYAIEATVLGLSATTSQVANEINSILLETRVGDKSIAEVLDKVVKDTGYLDGQLKGAIEPPSSHASLSPTAKAPPKSWTLRSVGNNVKHDLQKAVEGLPGAVTQFNDAAVKEIKEAAKTDMQAVQIILNHSQFIFQPVFFSDVSSPFLPPSLRYEFLCTAR
ncbi:Extracellular matrix-binding ebh, putative [Babesia ovata]|uniref:Extracellular matrix-binding ebh, putative n=1 Tax=Babesia ovata TaxID=189622 RepID=A0A2H6KD60_9APIC|nr:Extracellular matrix-binding ebh, putative [Babesia ovata]GBE60928.1 Extracellular matrix-binding ebh, putative [Babesia ovata]